MSAARSRRPAARNGNSTARSCGDRTIVRAIVCVMRAARSLWGRSGEDPQKKPEIELVSRMGCGMRSAEYVLAAKKGLSADGFARLLVSDAGPRLFRELTPHIDDTTLAAFGREIERARLCKQRDATARRLESLERGGG